MIECEYNGAMPSVAQDCSICLRVGLGLLTLVALRQHRLDVTGVPAIVPAGVHCACL